MHEFPGTGDPASLLPPLTDDNRPFFDFLREGRLAFQRCGACSRLRHPVAPVCPYCGGRSADWQLVSGRGSIHSWVRYHKCYLPEFEPLMPYVVVSVQLREGPRIFGRLAAGEPEVGRPVQTIVERLPSGECIHAFTTRGR